VEYPGPAKQYFAEPDTMASVAADLCALTGLLALLIFVVMSTTRINHTRRARLRMQKITARLLNLK